MRHFKQNIILAVTAIVLLSVSTGAQTPSPSKNLPNFHQVNEKLYRGGQPKGGGFAELKKLGITTVIDLRDDDENALKEKKLVEAAGMQFINFPLANWNRPAINDIDDIIAAIQAAANQPVFVHCKRGSDRTGTVIAVYRMTTDGKTAKEATDEAEDFGLGWWQFKMRDFINDYYRDRIKKMNGIIESYHADAIQSFRNYKKMAERAMEQISDEEFFALLDAEANSIAVIVKHIAGNLRSRWSDFLTSDGEKDFRNRDTEFEMIGDTRESLMQFWEAGWQTLFDAIEPLTTEDFSNTITIRGEPHTIAEAINRQLTHYAYHIGQIVLLAKHFKSSEWKTLSVPKNKSAQFNQFLTDKQAQGEGKLDRLEAPFEFSERNSQKLIK